MDSAIILVENPYDESLSFATVLMGLLKAVSRCEAYHPDPVRDPDLPAAAFKLDEPVTPGVFARMLGCRFAFVVPPGRGATTDALGRCEIAFVAEGYRQVHGAESDDDGWLVALRPAGPADLDAFLRLASGSTEARPWPSEVSAISLRHPACDPFEVTVPNRAFDLFAAAGSGTIALDERDADDGIPIHLDLENVQPIARIAPVRKELP